MLGYIRSCNICSTLHNRDATTDPSRHHMVWASRRHSTVAAAARDTTHFVLSLMRSSAGLCRPPSLLEAVTHPRGALVLPACRCRRVGSSSGRRSRTLYQDYCTLRWDLKSLTAVAV